MRRISYCEALAEATAQEMARDPTVFVYGIGVPDHKKIFGTTAGLVEKFGADRCFDTPLAEDALTGFGLGAAIRGMRPIQLREAHVIFPSVWHESNSLTDRRRCVIPEEIVRARQSERTPNAEAACRRDENSQSIANRHANNRHHNYRQSIASEFKP